MRANIRNWIGKSLCNAACLGVAGCYTYDGDCTYPRVSANVDNVVPSTGVAPFADGDGLRFETLPPLTISRGDTTLEFERVESAGLTLPGGLWVVTQLASRRRGGPA